ncbi:MAG: arsenite methyltransferase [Deltaproteobacteria bacterium]|nr:arsenite methyltransferase [Deltaproteobacteria bacterium]
MQTKEKIRQSVRESYGKVAKQGRFIKSLSDSPSCCGTDQKAGKDQQTGCGCGSKEIDLNQVSAFLGYSKNDLSNVPEGSNLGLGCGSPKTIAAIKKGETVIDLGSGGGFDCFLAAKEVGENGHVIGVDMTPEMITRARENKEKINADNVEFRLGEIEHLPVEDSVADLIISNCVINLSPDKEQVYQDAFRVLKPGGRMAISDIVALKPLPEDVKQDLAMVSACIGGAATLEQTTNMLHKAGFENIRIEPKKVSQELVDEWLPKSRAADYVAPAYIEARKPA